MLFRQGGLLERLERAEADEKGQDGGGAREDGDVGRDGHVLDDADAVALGRLAGTDHPVLGIVELAGFNQLARLFNGRREAAHVADGRGEIEAIQDLGYADLGGPADFPRAEIARGQRGLEGHVENGGLDDFPNIVDIDDF